MSFTPRPLDELALTWPPELDHFSASSAKMAVRCLEQWRQRYVLGRKAPPGLGLIGGKADHAAIELSMGQKISSYADLPLPEVKEAFVSVVEREVDQAGGLGELEWKPDQDTEAARTRAYDELRSGGQEVVGVYHSQVSPFLQPVAVEEKFSVELPGVPVPVIGYIDLVAHGVQPSLTLDSTGSWDDKLRVIDRKRRTRATLKIEPEWTIQAEVYQLIRPLPFEFHISVTTGAPRALWGNPELAKPVPPPGRSERLLEHIVNSVGYCYLKYGPDEPWPANGRLHPWACGYCGFRDRCWSWAS